jgi:hypothetical protein
MTQKSQQRNALKAHYCWLLCFGRCREVAKPAPFAMGFLAGYAGSNPASASTKGAAYASTVTQNASNINHKP